MAFFDLSWDQLQQYRPERTEPPEFDAFWERTLAEARAAARPPVFTPYDARLRLMECWDVTFSGFGGHPVKGWLTLPRQREGRLPAVVEFIGYGGGRGFPTDSLVWPAAGCALLVMDTRGQGSAWSKGDTEDLAPAGTPQFAGFMTRGILDPETYYYRRVMTDAARAVETLRDRPEIDPARIAVTGGSQGGGLTLAAAALVPDVAAAMPDVPFLCHYRRATEITASHPYEEISKYLAVHRDHEEQVFRTLSYFDGVNFAPRIRARTLVSIGLMDEICPPSTVMAMYQHLGCGRSPSESLSPQTTCTPRVASDGGVIRMGCEHKQLRAYRYNHHEGGGAFHLQEKIKFWLG